MTGRALRSPQSEQPPSHGPLVSMGKVLRAARSAGRARQQRARRAACRLTVTGRPRLGHRRKPRSGNARRARPRRTAGRGRGTWARSAALRRWPSHRPGRSRQAVRLAVDSSTTSSTSRATAPELEQAAHATRKVRARHHGARRAVPALPASCDSDTAVRVCRRPRPASSPPRPPSVRRPGRNRGPFPLFCPAPARRGWRLRNAQLTSAAPARHGALGIRTDDDKVALEVDPVQRPRGTARPS
jgi:hypothetical protein